MVGEIVAARVMKGDAQFALRAGAIPRNKIGGVAKLVAVNAAIATRTLILGPG